LFKNASIERDFVQLILLVLAIVAPSLADASTEIDGLSFADNPHVLFVSIEEIAPVLGWEFHLDEQSEQVSLNNTPLDPTRLRKLPTGPVLAPLEELQRAGATISWSEDGMQARVASGLFKQAVIRFADKRVEVDLANQRLRAYQGARLALDSHISSGREGRKTPPGDFRAGPLKSPMHRSRLYHNAPMPWSVQVHENIFIHGFQKVPRHPASHGCIRLPLAGANPAKWFYNWIDLGTPISIKGHWPVAEARATSPAFPFAHSSILKIIIVAAEVTFLGAIAFFFFLKRSRGKV
jgi:hypothetical protein